MQCCGLCLFRKPNDFYSTCTVLTTEDWKLAGTSGGPSPFWLAPRLRRLPSHLPNMTTRTLSTEGKNCAAYISHDIALAPTDKGKELL